MTSENRKKILFVITKSNWGGAQRYVYDLATSLPYQRYEAVVACGGNGDMAQKLKKRGIKVIQIESLQRDISTKKELASFFELRKIIMSESPDVLHLNSSKAAALGAVAGRISSVPRILFTAHGWAFNEDRSAISKFLLKSIHWLTIQLCHQTIAVSSITKNQMNWPGTKNKMTVVHNGREKPSYEARESARSICIKKNPGLSKHTDSLWIGCIGELHPIKRQEKVITALPAILQTNKNVCFVIIGGGEREAALKKLVVDNSLQDHVYFTGPIDEAARLLKAFDIFTLTSRSEALAYVIIEAMQAGVATIATEVGGIPEIINSSDIGVLVPPNDQEILQSKLQELVSNQQQRDALAKSASLRGNDFTLEKMVGGTTAIYDITESRSITEA